MNYNPRLSIYNLIILKILTEKKYESPYKMTKVISRYKGVPLTYDNIKNNITRLQDDGFIVHCKGDGKGRSKYMKITDLGRFEYRSLLKKFEREYRFYSRIHTDFFASFFSNSSC